MVEDLMRFICEKGAKHHFSKHINEFYDALDYFTLMKRDGRVIKIDEDGKTVGYILFSMCFEPDKYLKKGDWEYKPHFPQGDTVCIEKLISSVGWNKDLRKHLEKLFEKRFPNFKRAVWFKYAKWGDRMVLYKRRAICTK